MQLRRYGIGIIAVVLLTVSMTTQARGGKRSFEICVNPVADFGLVDNDASGTPTAGDIFTAVGGIWRRGAIPDGGAAFDCSNVYGERIGTFYTNGHFVRPLDPKDPAGPGFPAAPADDLALVVWHFLLDGKGTVDTMGPIKAVAVGDSYPQTVVGGTGKFKSTKGVAKTTVLGGGGFQFRLTVSNRGGDDD